MPRVLFGNVFFAPDSFGGATVVVEHMAKTIQSYEGWEVAACSVMSRQEVPYFAVVKMQSNGITNYTINVPPSRSDRDRYSGEDIAEAFDSILDAVSPDIVNLHCLQEVGAATLAAVKRRNLPLILSIHDFWWLCEKQFMINRHNLFCGNTEIKPENCVGCVPNMSATKRRDSYLRDQLDLPDLITVPSEYARSVHVNSGINRDRCIVLKNGVPEPVTSYWEHRKKLAEKRKRPVFAFIGGPGPVKGWPEIKKAVLALDRPDAEFRLVAGPLGHDWWGAEQLNLLPGQWKVVPRYDMDSIDNFFSAIDVMLFPSRWKETFGLTVREALVRGVYVVASDAGGAAEDCAPNVNSTILPFDFNSLDLAKTMQSIIDQGVPNFSPPQLHTEKRQALELKVLFEHLLQCEAVK